MEPTAKDLMTIEPMTIDETLSSVEATNFLLDHEISGAPVVDSSGTLVGVISLTDLARVAGVEGVTRSEHHQPDYFLRGDIQDANLIKGWEEEYDQEDLQQLQVHNQGLRVRDLMTPKVYTVDEAAPASEIARSMREAHVHRVLVVRDGALRGIVSSMDLLKQWPKK